MNLFKYQGAALIPGCKPGDRVFFSGIEWNVTDAGHLETEIPDPPEDQVLQMTTDFAAAEQTEPQA